MTATQPRRMMRDTVGIGQWWRRRSTGEIIVIRQVHRADNVVEAVYRKPVVTVAFKDLREKYELVGGGR